MKTVHHSSEKHGTLPINLNMLTDFRNAAHVIRHWDGVQSMYLAFCSFR
jgi:hypothetical protein